MGPMISPSPIPECERAVNHREGLIPACGPLPTGQAKTPDEQVVVLGQVLACDATLG